MTFWPDYLASFQKHKLVHNNKQASQLLSCPLAESLFSMVLCLNKCKRRHRSPLKNAEQAWLRLMLREKKFDVLQAEFLVGGGNVEKQVNCCWKHPKGFECSSVVRKPAFIELRLVRRFVKQTVCSILVPVFEGTWWFSCKVTVSRKALKQAFRSQNKSRLSVTSRCASEEPRPAGTCS